MAGGTSCRTSDGIPANGARGIDSGGGFRRRGSTKSPTLADGWVRALRLAGGGGGSPSLTFPLPRPPRRRSEGFIAAICIRHGSIKEKSGRGNRSGHVLIGDIH